MKLLFKQRFFSWFDSYDIYNENGETVYTVEGKISWGHKLHILNKHGEHIATVKQAIFTLMPRFDLYQGEMCVGSVQKKMSFLTPHYEMNFKGWDVRENFLEWDYNIVNSAGQIIATIKKEIFNFTDTYSIETVNDEDALYALMFTLAIDAEKCSRKD